MEIPDKISIPDEVTVQPDKQKIIVEINGKRDTITTEEALSLISHLAIAVKLDAEQYNRD